MTHWAKFGEAARDIRSTPVFAEFQQLYSTVALLLERGQRFYLPDGANILEDKLIDEEIQKLIRLPFDSIAVLREQMLLDAPSPDLSTSWTITVALERDSAF